jgi:uncharacterized membrane protein YccF (DUF307 family)
MRLLLNIIWFVFGGLWLALGYFLAGIVCCILIVTIPFGIAAFRNVVWIIVAGIWLAIGHVLTAIAMAITIVGIPLALANLKMIPVSLMPLGKDIVDSDAVGVVGAPAPMRY